MAVEDAVTRLWQGMAAKAGSDLNVAVYLCRPSQGPFTLGKETDT